MILNVLCRQWLKSSTTILQTWGNLCTAHRSNSVIALDMVVNGFVHHSSVRPNYDPCMFFLLAGSDVAWRRQGRPQIVLNYEEGGENCLLHGDEKSESLLSEIVGSADLTITTNNHFDVSIFPEPSRCPVSATRTWRASTSKQKRRYLLRSSSHLSQRHAVFVSLSPFPLKLPRFFPLSQRSR